MNKEEALRLALEALESHIVWFSRDTMIGKAMRKKAEDSITAIKQALEQPAPYRAVKTYHDGKPVYVQEPPKREWQRLTDVDVSKILDEQNGFYTFEKCFNFAKAIEAKLKERNHDQ